MSIQDVYRALADPTRRAILRQLQQGDRPAGEIAGAFEMSWPAVSRHLRVLSDAGLIRAARDGQHLVYTLTTSVLVDIAAELAELAEVGANAPSEQGQDQPPASMPASPSEERNRVR
jgi:DNA-binding transcriptional ArsR family regulator